MIWSVAFDNSGDLWVQDVGNRVIEELTPSQLSTTGNVTPNITLHYAGHSTVSMAFNPTPPGLPLP